MEHKRIDARALTTKQAAIYIGMSSAYLERSRIDGPRKNRTPAPQFIKIGRKSVRYLREDLDTWIQTHRKYDFTGQGV